MSHTLALLSQLGTFLTVLGGVGALFWKGTRHANRFIDSVQDNTKATRNLTAGLETVTKQTRDNTDQIASLTTSTDANTSAIQELGGRVTNLEETLK